MELILLLVFCERLSEHIDFFLLCLCSPELFAKRLTWPSTLSAILFQPKFQKKLLQRLSQIQELGPLPV